jgi:hypothetical protein
MRGNTTNDRMRLRIVFLASLCLLGACSDDDGGGEAVTTSTTTSTTATTTAVGTTGTTACPPEGEPLWRPAGSGASTDIYELRVVVDCEEVAVRQFAVGGTVRELRGVRCEDGRVVDLVATSEDGRVYSTAATTYELRGTELVEVDRSTGELPADDPALRAYQAFDC